MKKLHVTSSLILSLLAPVCGGTGLGTGGEAPETVLLQSTVRRGGEAVALTLKARPLERALMVSGKEKTLAGALYSLEAVRPTGERLRVWQTFRNVTQTGQVGLGGFRIQGDNETGRVLLAFTQGFSVFAYELDVAVGVTPIEQEGPVRLEGLRLQGSKPSANEIRIADSLPEDVRARIGASPPEVRGIVRNGDRWVVTVACAGQELTFRWEGDNTEWRPLTDRPPRPEPRSTPGEAARVLVSRMHRS